MNYELGDIVVKESVDGPIPGVVIEVNRDGSITALSLTDERSWQFREEEN